MKKYFIPYIGSILLSGVCSFSFGQFITNNGIAINNTAHVVSNGTWTNDPGTTILNNGIIQTTESFTNNGTLNAASTGGFVLKFATDMNFRPGGSRMGFLTKEGTGNALTDGTISVKDSLLLRGGLIKLLNATDTVSVRAGGLVLASSTAYVEGLVARAGTGDFLFPFGKDGLYLPLKVYKVNAKKITASIKDAPAGYVAGPGVDALISFPYAWKVSKKDTTDALAYVEINYPNTLPVVANPIVARAIPTQKYASMGARSISNAAGRVIVKSYSRGMSGTYTIAQGFPTDLVTDSLALVSLYNATGGPAWTTRTNWLTGDVDAWFGVTVNGQSITAVNLPGNKLTGNVPDPLVDILALQTVNLSGNSITAIPDFTLNPQITTLNVSNNKLNFASLEPNAGVTGLSYLVQADLGLPKDSLVAVNSRFEFAVNAGGASSQYQWKRNGQAVSGATAAVYEIPSINRETMGDYIVDITNPTLPGLTLHSALQKTIAYATLGGKLMAEPSVPATKGSLTLLRVNPSAFDKVATVNVQPDGSYSFQKIILDDYQLLGFADTLVYVRALPTYFENTIFWEEADTVFLGDNISTLDIISALKPGPPSGKGSISGFIEEEVEGGRVKDGQKVNRISGAGVSARRVENTGRGKEEILTLVAYVFTNEDGEFLLPNLPTGEYRLNIQYPGYPMDENSFITIPIGTALKSQVSVEAHVIDGKINVRKLIITGLHDTENYEVQLYPNPAVEFVRLNFNSTSTGREISLSDLSGKTLITKPAEEKEAIVSMNQINRGIYLLRIKEQGVTVKTLKVSIE